MKEQAKGLGATYKLSPLLESQSCSMRPLWRNIFAMNAPFLRAGRGKNDAPQSLMERSFTRDMKRSPTNAAKQQCSNAAKQQSSSIDRTIDRTIDRNAAKQAAKQQRSKAAKQTAFQACAHFRAS